MDLKCFLICKVVSCSKESKNENQSQLSLADEPNEIAKYPEVIQIINNV